MYKTSPPTLEDGRGKMLLHFQIFSERKNDLELKPNRSAYLACVFSNL